MKRRVGVLVGLVVVVLAFVLWQRRGDRGAGADERGSGSANHATSTSAAVGVMPKAKIDPRTQPRGSISGTIRDKDARPIANATVCLALYSDELPPDFWDEAPCKNADANGAYEWTDLFVAKYAVTASARGFRFDYHYPKGRREATRFDLGPGEHKKNVDVTLHPGGVEITGVVNDISGGPIAHARVRASLGMWGGSGATPPAETDEKGAFTLWVPQGTVRVTARADGYAPGEQRGRAPGTFEILLTPESSLSGIVVDARTEQPLEGADVSVERTQWDGLFSFTSKRTDDKGAFRIDGLSPGRYTAIVHGQKGYGRSEGSTLVGLGQHVTGVIVRVHPTARVIGKVVLAGTKEVCIEGGVALRDEDSDRWLSGSTDDDGTITVHGVLPGTYKAQAWCPKKVGRDEYDKIVVVDKDITGLVWEVTDGAVIAGKVTGKSGQPIADATIQGQITGGDARAKEDWTSDRTDVDGTYELRSLKTATYRLEVDSEAGVADRDGYKVDAKGGQIVTKDIVLDDGGTLTGSVVDETGKPVANATIHANAIRESTFMFWDRSPEKSDASGAFTLTGLRPGEYRVTAGRGWMDNLRKPGTTDDAKQGEKTTIEAGKTSTVKLVVESQSGVIKGVVLDAEGAPVSDAFISKARESDAAGAGTTRAHSTRWGWGDEKPVLTAVDGTFSLTELAPGKYTLRAFRKGGGEALLEHVAVGTTNAKLQIKHTGSIEGTVKSASGKLPDEVEVSVEDLKTGFERTEKFFRTNGRFALRDLPAGHFHVNANAAGGQAKIELDLANGEQKTGVTLTLEELVTLTGRVVDYATKAPVPGIRVFAQIAQGGSFSFRWTDETDNISDTSGRFTVKKVPRGKLSIQGMAKEWKGADYAWFRVLRDLTTSTESTIDIGDVSIMKRRVKDGEPAGEMGLRFKEQPPETPPEQQEIRVSFIEPDGPAAKTDIKVGDVIVTVDGVDVTGANGMHAWTLMNAPPGTKLVLGISRGGSTLTIPLTLAPPS